MADKNLDEAAIICPKCGSKNLIAVKLATAAMRIGDAEEYDPEHIKELTIGMILDEVQRIECLQCNLSSLPEVFDYGDYEFKVCNCDKKGYYMVPPPRNCIYSLNVLPDRAYFTDEEDGRIYFMLSKLHFAKTVGELPTPLVSGVEWLRELAVRKFEELK